MATKLPQSPYDQLSKILCDADLYYLGGDDYIQQASKLYEELKNTGTPDDIIAWKNRQIDFLSSHNYFTETAKKNRNTGKQANLNKLKKDATVQYLPPFLS